MLTWLAAGAVALVSVVISSLSGTNHFLDGACQRVNKHLHEEVVGQELAIDHLVAAICNHLQHKDSKGPLVLSAHGPPGVGKTLTHQLLARALYQAEPAKAVNCPGPQCTGYKVIYGMDFLSSEAGQQLAAVRSAILEHLRHAPESLLVIEEYDKLDCASRAMFRQLLDHPEAANVSMSRSIVLLESNLGMNQLKNLVEEVGGRHKVTLKDASYELKQLMYGTWQDSTTGQPQCESKEDTLKLVGMIGHYLPYLPMGQRQVEKLLERELLQRRQRLLDSHGVWLEWDKRLLPFLIAQVEFFEGLSVDGARAVTPVIVNIIETVLLRPSLVEVLDALLEHRKVEAAASWGKPPPKHDSKPPTLHLTTPLNPDDALEFRFTGLPTQA